MFIPEKHGKGLRTMMESFFEDRPGEDESKEWSRGFMAPGGGRRFGSDERELKRRKIRGAEARAVALILRFPLLSKSCVREVLGREEAETLSVLFHDGILGRFYEIDQSGNGDKKLTRVVYYASEAGRALFGRTFPGSSFPPSAIADMTSLSKAELSGISEYAARACHGPAGGKLLSLDLPGREKPWMEALIQKRGAFQPGERVTRCLFHVIRRPLVRERVPAFLEMLYYINERTLFEEGKEFRVKSWVVILCESDDDMERFAAFLSRHVNSGHLPTGAADRFLYALEEDAHDSGGAFKFLSRITFEAGTIKKSQVAFQ